MNFLQDFDRNFNLLSYSHTNKRKDLSQLYSLFSSYSILYWLGHSLAEPLISDNNFAKECPVLVACLGDCLLIGKELARSIP